MKLATLNDGSRDGSLVVVSRDLSRCIAATDIAPTLQAALDAWDACGPRLAALFDDLQEGRIDGDHFDQNRAHSPLPRAYQWADDQPMSITWPWCDRHAGPKCPTVSGQIR